MSNIEAQIAAMANVVHAAWCVADDSSDGFDPSTSVSVPSDTFKKLADALVSMQALAPEGGIGSGAVSEAVMRDASTALALLHAICIAQVVEPYQGWNLTALNNAVDRTREYLGLPSIRELNPDIAKMQDHAAANKDSLSALLERDA